MYLFPGENGAAGKAKAAAPPPASVGEGLDFSPSEDSEGESEATDDFCILDAPGTGIPVRASPVGNGAAQLCFSSPLPFLWIWQG